MAENRDQTFTGPDGLQARLTVTGQRFAVDIDWGGSTECWDQPVGSAEAATQLFDDYVRRLETSGYRSGSSSGSRLDAAAVQQVAERLMADGDLVRAAIVQADLAEDAAALERALGEMASGPREVACLSEPLVRLGSHVWAFDDDGVHGSEDPDPVWAELRAHLRRQPARSLRLQCFGPLAPALDAARGALTHLIVSPMRPEPVMGPAPPGLLALTGSIEVLRPWLSPPTALPELEALTLWGNGEPPLDALAKLPSLRHLGVWNAPSSTHLRVVGHPIVQQLETLDLWSIRPPPLAALSARKAEWAHLHRLFLGGHQVSTGARRELSAIPGVRFVSYDRGEVLGHDLLRIGYPSGSR